MPPLYVSIMGLAFRLSGADGRRRVEVGEGVKVREVSFVASSPD